jgi:integrase
MATLVFRRNSRKVYIYYSDKRTGKLRQVERKLTKHLDGQPPEVAQAWMEQWERDNGIVRDRVNRKLLKEGDKLSGLWRQYQDFKVSDSDTERRKKTVEAESFAFERYIVAFFVGQHEKKDPSQWHPFVPEFHLHLSRLGISASYRATILWVLERFGASLVFTQYMSFPFAVRPPKSKVAKVTPLKIRKTPEEIIKFARDTKFSNPEKLRDKDKAREDINWSLAVLLGYFGGFGPGELFALEKSDLLTGDSAEQACKTLVGFRKHGLGSRLGVIINKTLPPSGDCVPLVKNDYRFGVSNIWNAEAAKLISQMVKSRPEGRLFPFSYGHLVRRFREIVSSKLGATPHDLRRASGLYLGRVVRLELTLLQEHMRHAEIETTMLYTREPALPEKKVSVKQDFDDVA